MLAMLFCIAIASAEPPTTIPMATGEWPPFVSAHLPDQGSFVAALRGALRKHGMELDLTFTSWPLAEQLVATGKVFAAFPYVQNPARAAKFDFSLPVMATRSVVFYRGADGNRLSHYRTPADLAHVKVAVLHGYWYEDLLKQNNADMIYTADESSAFRVLLMGRADAVIQDENVGRYLLERDYAEQMSHIASSSIGIGDAHQYLMLMVSRGYPGSGGLLKRIDAALAELPVNVGSPSP